MKVLKRSSNLGQVRRRLPEEGAAAGPTRRTVAACARGAKKLGRRLAHLDHIPTWSEDPKGLIRMECTDDERDASTTGM